MLIESVKNEDYKTRDMEEIINVMKFFDDILAKKGKMTTKEFTNSRKSLRAKFQEEMDKLATEYAVRNSKFHVGDNVKVRDVLVVNAPCTIQRVVGRYNVMMEKGTPEIVYSVKFKHYDEIFEVTEDKIID